MKQVETDPRKCQIPNALSKCSLNVVKSIADHGELCCVDAQDDDVFDELPLGASRLIMNGGDPGNLHELLSERRPVRAATTS